MLPAQQLATRSHLSLTWISQIHIPSSMPGWEAHVPRGPPGRIVRPFTVGMKRQLAEADGQAPNGEREPPGLPEFGSRGINASSRTRTSKRQRWPDGRQIAFHAGLARGR